MRENGEVPGSWLLQILVVLALFALTAHEAVAVAVSAANLDDAGREVARTARDAYRSTGSVVETTAAAEDVAVTHEAVVDVVRIDDDVLVVELWRTAPTLVLHRMGPARELATVRTTTRISRTSQG